MESQVLDFEKTTQEIIEYVRSFFQTNCGNDYVYHNFSHTQYVARAAAQIGNHFQLSKSDFFIVTAAAWFHDTGYFVNCEQHEIEGTVLAENFLKEKGIPEDFILKVKNCILATRLPQKPNNLLEEIVCDADLFHLGTNKFSKTNKQMRKEFEARKGEKISKADWRDSTIRLLESHEYHTDYCRLLLSDKKNKNLKDLKDQKAADEEQKPLKDADQLETVKEKIKENRKKKDATGIKKRPDRGIETMFRVTSANNQRMSNMADNKAHIMITVNSIILSAIISLVLRRLDEEEYLALPSYILLLVCVSTIIFSILATRPSVPSGIFNQDDLNNEKVNLLFFGNFYKMSLDDYTKGMLRVMDNEQFLYGSLIKDVYSQGIVLGRKYRLLRISYNIFMFGLIISVLGFVIATLTLK